MSTDIQINDNFLSNENINDETTHLNMSHESKHVNCLDKSPTLKSVLIHTGIITIMILVLFGYIAIVTTCNYYIRRDKIYANYDPYTGCEKGVFFCSNPYICSDVMMLPCYIQGMYYSFLIILGVAIIIGAIIAVCYGVLVIVAEYQESTNSTEPINST